MKEDSFVSIVIPVYNDQEVLHELHRRLKIVIEENIVQSEIIFIDDGSVDGSLSMLLEIKEENPSVKVIELARNFGQANAIAAGLDHAKGELIVLMDSDLQDRPEDIPVLIQALKNSDASMAIARWKIRKDSFFKKLASTTFNRVSKYMTGMQIPRDLGVFRVMRRSILDSIISIPEKTGTVLSLIYWAGFKYVPVDLDRDARYAGKSGYNLKKMLQITADRIFSYSLMPIRIAVYTGIILGFGGIGLGLFLAIRKLYHGAIVPGWTSTVVVSLFLFAINFFFLGIIGEYVGRVYKESKGRPKYFINKRYF